MTIVVSFADIPRIVILGTEMVFAAIMVLEQAKFGDLVGQYVVDRDRKIECLAFKALRVIPIARRRWARKTI